LEARRQSQARQAPFSVEVVSAGATDFHSGNLQLQGKEEALEPRRRLVLQPTEAKMGREAKLIEEEA
jgi:hypothetical protein